MELKDILRREEFFIGHPVVCAFCGELYIPSELKHLSQLNVLFVLANNWCSWKCWNNYSESKNKKKGIYK